MLTARACVKLTAESSDDRSRFVETVVDTKVVVRTVFGTGTDGTHWTGHDVLATLTIYIELLVLYVQFDEWQSGVEPILAMQCPWIDTRISRTLNVASLQSTVLESALAVSAGHDFTPALWVKLGMLPIA